MKIDFCFEKDMTYLTFHKGIKKKDVRGFYNSLSDILFVNLSARQWKSLSEDNFIYEIGNTITHEIIHYFQKGCGIEIEIEERVCELMADQTEIKDGGIK